MFVFTKEVTLPGRGPRKPGDVLKDGEKDPCFRSLIAMEAIVPEGEVDESKDPSRHL